MKRILALLLSLLLVITALPITASAGSAGSAETSYYLIGTNTRWLLNKGMKLSPDPAENGLYVIRSVRLGEGDNIKVVSVDGGTDAYTWFPDGVDNGYYVGAGCYDIYFSPACDRDGWYAGCIDVRYAQDNPPALSVIADGVTYSVEPNIEYEYTCRLNIGGFVTAVDGAVDFDASGLSLIEADFPRLKSKNLVQSTQGNSISFNAVSVNGARFDDDDCVLVTARFYVAAEEGAYEVKTNLTDLAAYPEKRIIVNGTLADASAHVQLKSTLESCQEPEPPTEHMHGYGEWIVDSEPTCTAYGTQHRVCLGCGDIEYGTIPTIPHTFATTDHAPTYTRPGYRHYECTVCGYSFDDEYVDPLERISINDADISLEYTHVYYQGYAPTPAVSISYNGEALDPDAELSIEYLNNDTVGTASVRVTGVNRFIGERTLQFTIAYETIPTKIVNVIGVGEINMVSLSWGKAAEVGTNAYRVYRREEGTGDFACIATVNGRDSLEYEDYNVEVLKTYEYYITGVAMYGAESEPSDTVTATVLADTAAPTILKMTPQSAGVIYGSTWFSVTAIDNIGVTKVIYDYSVDNGESWIRIGESRYDPYYVDLDTSVLGTESVKVRAIAYDAMDNASAPYLAVYSLDNIGSDKVTGLKAIPLSSKITLTWNDVEANDASYFILQSQTDGVWKTVESNITRKGTTVTGLLGGTAYTYRVACVDTHGNTGEYSDPITVTTLSDTSAPVITALSPSSSRCRDAINFSAMAKDDCDVEQMIIQVSQDRTAWTDVSSKTFTDHNNTKEYSCRISLDDYAEGSIYVRAVAVDFAGNVSDTGASAPFIEYIVDRTAPAAPTGLSAEGCDGYISLKWDVGSEFDLGSYYVYRAVSADGVYTDISGGVSSYNYFDRNIEEGKTYYYRLKSSDTCGNLSGFSAAVSAMMSPDTVRPEITGISSTFQQRISPAVSTITVSAADNNMLSSVTVEYSTSLDSEYKVLDARTDIAGHYCSLSVTLPLEGLSDGDVIYVRAGAVDMAGLKSDYGTARYYVDTLPPAVQNFETEADTRFVTLTWDDCGEEDLAGFRVYRSGDGTNFELVGSRGVSSGSYTFTDTITEQASNTYIYKLESIDKVGNTASWLKTVEYIYTYVNKAPVAVIDAPDSFIAGVEEMLDGSRSRDDIVITAYHWDFGDGTSSNEVRPVKKYTEPGEYTVTLSVTDNEGVTTTDSVTITVSERDLFGELTVAVFDDWGSTVPNVPVYFDLGSENQRIVYTDYSGEAKALLVSGTHTIGMYASGYLPVKKDVVVLANAHRTVSLTTVKEEIVTGKFEVTRMTFDEIVAAGIDVTDPANQQVYSATVRVFYSATNPVDITYIRNDSGIISFKIFDSNGGGGGGGDDDDDDSYWNYSGGGGGGGGRTISSICWVPIAGNQTEVIAIVDIPAKASYLKEFFDVRLHIVNNASPEFTLEMNQINLNVPDGMTLMDSVKSDYLSSSTVNIPQIRGQETVTLSWVLRGDRAGEYNLSADYTGTLALFNELVTARFETSEPIKVYGLEGVKFRILAADEIHNDALYFSIELENQRDIDIYMPMAGVTDKIANVTDKVLANDDDGVFFVDAILLNVYLESSGGVRQFVPFRYDANDNVVTDIDVLAPGQKIVCEYVAYNAVNIDGTGYFLDAAVMEYEGLFDNIEVGSFHKELYSFNDYTDKLDKIINSYEDEISDAYLYINDDDNYYYVEEAMDYGADILAPLCNAARVFTEGNLTAFTHEEKRDFAQEVIMDILTDSENTKLADELVYKKFDDLVKDYVSAIKLDVINQYADTFYEGDGSYIDDVFESIAEDSLDLIATLRTDGDEAFISKLNQTLVGYGVGISINLMLDDYQSIIKSELKYSTLFVGDLFSALSKTERDAYLRAVLQTECNTEYCDYMLDTIISYTCDKDIRAVAEDLKEKIHSTLSKSEAEMRDFYKNFAGEIASTAAKLAIKKLVKTALAGVSGWIILAVDFAFKFINIEGYAKQEDALDVYYELCDDFLIAFHRDAYSAVTDSDKMYALFLLKAACEMRLDGESKFKSFMEDYMTGRIGGIGLSEDEVLIRINGVRNTSYWSFDEWFDDVQYKILTARDLLFNIEETSPIVKPRAPVVTLNYDTNETVQSYDASYEYCFGDGVWRNCSDNPISFTVKDVPSTLRVRKSDAETGIAGEITTVKIFASKDLSKLIKANFDGVNYTFTGLSSAYSYQIYFTGSENAAADWNNALTCAGSDTTLTVGGVGETSYAVIRTCINPSKQETYSRPLTVKVAKKKPFNLKIDGSGSVTQSAASGCYYNGDTVDLVARPNAGCSFIGWFVNGVRKSGDLHYIVEMADGLEVTAQFSGVKIRSIAIDHPANKLAYIEGESIDTTGMTVKVTYEDDTTAYADQFSTELSSNEVGKRTVVVGYGGFYTAYDVTISHGESDWVTTIIPTLFNEGLCVKICPVCHKVVATQVLAMLSDSSGIQVDADEDYISHFPEELMSADALMQHYKELGYRVKVLDAKQNNADGVMTGGYVIARGTSYTAVVFGDTTGDGEIDIFDILGMLDHVNGDTELVGAYKKAGMVVNNDVDDDIDVFDALAVLDYVNGSGELNP